MKGTFFKVVGVLTLVLALAGCAGGDGLTSSVPTTYVPPAPRTLTVTGYGEARGNPDMATISVGVNISDTNISTAVGQSNEAIAKITAAMEALGIASEDIQTTAFNVWPEDIWDTNTGQPTGQKRYHVDSTMQINIRSIDDVGKVLETALSNGANNIYGLNFGIQETASLTAQARTAAIADARLRADAIAADLGVTLGRVSSASDQSGGVIYPYFIGAGWGIGGGGGEPPISQGQMAVSVSLSVSFEILH